MSAPQVTVELHLVVPELGDSEPATVLVKDIEVDEDGLTSLVSMAQFVGAKFGGTVIEVVQPKEET